MNLQRHALLLIILTSIFVFAGPVLQRSHAQLNDVGRFVPPTQRKSIDEIDHKPFDALLKKFVNEDGQVNYRQWKKSATDRQSLQHYLDSLSSADTSRDSSQAGKLAFWINAYNAVTIEGILDVYPTSSIRNHTKRFGYNLWKDLKLTVGDAKINLDDIEHKILRKMNEPRIHFAIVCASIGCPRLLNQAYTAEQLESQLAANTRDFFSRSQNLKYDPSRKQIQLSAILKWFGSDFGLDSKIQTQTIAPYFPKNIRKIVRQGGYSIGYQDYDWNLNEQK